MYDRIGKQVGGQPPRATALNSLVPGKHTLTAGGTGTSSLDLHAARTSAVTGLAGRNRSDAAGAATDGDATSHGGAAVTRDLGVFASMVAFEVGLARLLLQIAPHPGDSATLSLSASVYVEGIVAKLSLEAGVEHGADDFTLSGSVATMFGIGEESEGGGGELGVQEEKGLSVVGPDPQTCIEEIGLYVDRWLRAQQWRPSSFRDPRKWLQLAELVCQPSAVKAATLIAGDLIADLLFGRGFEKQVLSHMDEGNEIEATRKLSLEGSVDLGSKQEGAELHIEAGFGVEERTTYTKGSDGELETEIDDGVTAHLGFELTVGGVTVEVEGERFEPVGGAPEVELTVSLELETDLPGDAGKRLRDALAFTKAALGLQLASTRLDSDDLLDQLFGAAAMPALEACAHSVGLFNRVGIRFDYDGDEVVAQIYSGASHEEKTGVVNVETEVQLLHEVGRWRAWPTAKALHHGQ